MAVDANADPRRRSPDTLRCPLFPLLDRVWRMAVGICLLSAADLGAAAGEPSSRSRSGRLDGIRHPPGRLHLDRPPAASFCLPASAAGCPWIPAALRGPGVALRALRPPLQIRLASHRLADRLASASGPVRRRVRLPPAISELYRGGADATAAHRPDRRSRRALAFDRGSGSDQRRRGGCPALADGDGFAKPDETSARGIPTRLPLRRLRGLATEPGGEPRRIRPAPSRRSEPAEHR